MSMEEFSNLENNAIVLLSYLADNPLLWQTYRGISKETGISPTTLYEMVNGFSIWGPNNWALATYAEKYGFEVEFIGYPGRILYVQRKTNYGTKRHALQ